MVVLVGRQTEVGATASDGLLTTLAELKLVRDKLLHTID